MDELQISGKRFISSRRIARENGYTSDYIGQLIRGGKITGQKVGRAWYVDALSFDAYLGSEGSVKTATPVVVVERYIVPVVKEEVKIPEAITETPIVLEAETIKKEPVYHVPLHIIKKEEPVEEKKEAGGLHYYHDDAPGLPEIRTDERESRIESVKTPASTHSFKNSALPRPRAGRPARFVALGAVGLTVFIFCAVVSSAITLNLSIEAGNTAATSYSLPW